MLAAELKERLCCEVFLSLTESPSINEISMEGHLETQSAPRVAFFTWTAALGKILTADNLRKRNIVIVSWCCMCKIAEESIDHLFHHCPVAKELWDAILNLFGVHWVMPRQAKELLEGWHVGLSKHRQSGIWNAVPHYFMWGIWRDRNLRTFEGNEINIGDLKLLFF